MNRIKECQQGIRIIKPRHIHIKSSYIKMTNNEIIRDVIKETTSIQYARIMQVMFKPKHLVSPMKAF